MPRAKTPPLSTKVDIEKLRFRMDAQTRSDIARELGSQALPNAAAEKIEHAVLVHRAAVEDVTTPGMSIEAINDALKLKKKFTRAMGQFIHSESGVDYVTFLVLNFYARQCQWAFKNFEEVAGLQKKQLTDVRHMDMGKEKRKVFCLLLGAVFEEYAALDYRTGPDDEVRRRKRDFVWSVANAADIDLKVDADGHPERLDALIGASPADAFTVRS